MICYLDVGRLGHLVISWEIAAAVASALGSWPYAPAVGGWGWGLSTDGRPAQGACCDCCNVNKCQRRVCAAVGDPIVWSGIKTFSGYVNHWRHPCPQPRLRGEAALCAVLHQLLCADCSRPGLSLDRETERDWVRGRKSRDGVGEIMHCGTHWWLGLVLERHSLALSFKVSSKQKCWLCHVFFKPYLRDCYASQPSS